MAASPQTASRTLIIHLGGIGDFLLCCPAIAHLHTQGPVELLGTRSRLELAVAFGIADAAHDADSVDFGSIFSTASDRLRDFLARFDRCIAWMRDDGTVAARLRECGISDVRTFPGLPSQEFTGHVSEYYLKCIEVDRFETRTFKIDPFVTLRKTIIHPGSGGKCKNWPLDKFISIANILESKGQEVVWCCGPAEEGMNLPEGHHAVRVESLVELARTLAGATLYVGNDSGVTHLAAAVGCPTVAVFGPTDPERWAPCGPHVTVVQATPWPDEEVVLRAINNYLS